MKYEITNNSGADKAFKVLGGLRVVKRGKTETVDVQPELKPEQIAAHEAKGVSITPLDKKAARAHAIAEAAAAEAAAKAEAERKAAEAAKAAREALFARAAEMKLEPAADITDEALKALIEAAAKPEEGK